MSDPRSSQIANSGRSPGEEKLSSGSQQPAPSGDSATRLKVALPELVRPQALLEDQVTIISSRAPLGELPDARPLAPLEVGRMLEGERLGQFVLQKFVGGGGMGAVFRALDTTLNREVAVKVLSRFQADEEETLRRFRNEAQSAARLDHGNIARVYYVGCDRGLHYIVFEFIEGENLRDLVERKGPLPVVEAISYTLQVAEALTHASQRDVIHRDIKPSNVIVSPDGKAKLVDMGLARLHQVDQPDQDITASGITLGTFDYISPEQARDPRIADVRSDLYSLGCSLFFMLTGQPPFPHGTVLQKLLQHQGDEPPDARNFRGDLPAELCRVMGRLLAKNPTDRYQLPGDLIIELVSLGRQLGMTASTSVNVDWTLPSQPAVGPWERHLPWLLPLAMLVLAVVMLDYIWRSPGADGGTWPAARQSDSAPSGAGRSEPGRNEPGRIELRRGGVGLSPAPDARPVSGTSDADPVTGQGGTNARPSRSVGSSGGTPAVGPELPGGKLPARAEADREVRGAKGSDSSQRPGGVSAANPTAPITDAGLLRVAPVPGDSPAGDMPSGAMPPATTPPAATMPPDAMPPGAMPVSGQPALGVPNAPPAGAAATVGTSAGAMPSGAMSTSSVLPGQPAGSLPSGAGTRTEKPEANADAQRTVVGRDDLLIVGDPDERGRSFANLQAACAAAKSGDIVELRFNGPRDERPILLSGAKLTIRAGERYAPVVRFRPVESDPLLSPRSMVTVAGGQLTLIGLQFDLDVPRGVPDDAWTLIALEQADSLRMERCVLTLRNAGVGQGAFHEGAAFFSLLATAGAPSIMHDLQGAEEHAVALQLQNCAVRGEATFLRDDSRQGVHLSWDNGWLAVSGRLLTLGSSMQARQGGPIDLDLRHVTAVARAGLLLIDDDPMSMNLLPVEFKSADCIFATPSLSGSPLVEQRTADPANDYRARLNWNGDRTWYQGFDVFWRVVDAANGDPLQLSFSQWLATWGEAHESLARWGSVRWRTPPPAETPFDAQIPADYQLTNDGNEGSPVGNASDGRDAGGMLDLLPSLRPAAAEREGGGELP